MNSRRNLLKSLGAGVLVAGIHGIANAEEKGKRSVARAIKIIANTQELILLKEAIEGEIFKTLGYYHEHDAGGALYLITKKGQESPGAIILKNGLVAELLEGNSVNYQMFGTKSDGDFDDGMAIKSAHEYANKYNIPVINRHGEFWIKATNDINIQTSVEWGATIFHIDEQFNTPKAFKFNITSTTAIKDHQLDATDKSSLVEHLVPGVTEIAALNKFRGNLIYVEDKNDRIGYRAGARFDGQSWAKQELFFVEDHGKVIGDIAYRFKDFTSFEVIPVDDTYLTISGGCFVLSGNSSGKGYTKNGIAIRRSRTIISKQVVRLAQGAVDTAPNARTGFYNFHKVYEVRLEDIKLIPYEQDREGTEHDVPAGTYGISGDRILNGTFRNVTAEGGKVHWGVFGTNMNKNFTIELCRLNRVDVHFHCWNVRIHNTHIGHRGISVTGGGDLTVRDCVVEGRNIINFRQDFGSKWDGDIRIENVHFKPSVPSSANLLEMSPSNFNYHYPIVLGRTIIVQNIQIDSTSMNPRAEIQLINFPKFAKMDHGERVIFPSYIEFSNVFCRGAVSGVKGFQLLKPQGFYVDKNGSYDSYFFQPNVQVRIDRVELLDGKSLNNYANPYHFSFVGSDDIDVDEHSAFIEIEFIKSRDLQLKADAIPMQITVRDSSISRFEFGEQRELQGELYLDHSKFAPNVNKLEQVRCDYKASLGNIFSNTTIHSPRIQDKYQFDAFELYKFIEINKQLLGTHINTRLGKEYVEYLASKQIKLNPAFLNQLLISRGEK